MISPFNEKSHITKNQDKEFRRSFSIFGDHIVFFRQSKVYYMAYV